MILWIFLLFTASLQATGLYDEELSSDQAYIAIVDAAKEDNWVYVKSQSIDFLREYDEDPSLKDIYFYLGLAHYHHGDFERSNDCLTEYLETTTAATHFEEALLHKFWVAEHFRAGSKKRIFKWQRFPIYLSAYEDALDIYDQVITALPFSDLCLHSLYGKAKLQTYFEEYKESIQTYQNITQKFSKDELAVESYIEIAKLYLHQCKTEHLDPDFLASAENNYRKFQLAFPGEERLEEAKNLLHEMREAFANHLYETGRFYERTYKPKAACIYYRKAASQFPNTLAAEKCQKRLSLLA
ncbi:MAG: hypothetical protein AAGI90_04090 [Chlamydiota bacterium]